MSAAGASRAAGAEAGDARDVDQRRRVAAQGPTAKTQMSVLVRLDAKVDPFEARPAGADARRLPRRALDSGGAFESISETLGEPGILDTIGILAGSISRPTWTAPARSRCGSPTNLVMPDLQPGSALCRITAFDVIGRPSDPDEGDLSTIELPWLPPPPPVNPAKRIVIDAGNLMFEVGFEVNGARRR